MLPLAGLGTRLRPHTYSKPKPLVSVAGKTVLGHVLDSLDGLPIDEVIFITGYLGDQIEEYVRSRYSFPARFVEQTDLRGQAHAINLASDFIDQPVLIIFVDTIVKADLTRLLDTTSDGVLYVKEVDDPRRFGVAVLNDGQIVRLVEKPKTPVSNLAVIGVYYLRNWQLLREALRDVIALGIQTGGEYYLADALQLMIDRHARFEAWPVEAWEDCGTVQALVQTNRYLLSHGHDRQPTAAENTDNSIIIPPVYVAPTARIQNSVVGPDVSVADGVTIRDSIVRDSILSDGATISGVALTESVVGSNAVVKGSFRRLNVGDASEVEVG
ncbi:MAG TPA: sugar phosphate nucleotidyltransferase [Chloroflexota bacterium]|nr:sugar phosphate nucleotidyltransferase [Chloroflexota bacterium]